MRRLVSSLIFCTFALCACGQVTNETNTAPTPAPSSSPVTSTDLNHPTGNTAVVLGANFTDPNGTLSYIPLISTGSSIKNLQVTHSDATVRSFGNILYVVNRLGGDNIEVVDAGDFHVINQFSVGRGTNPQDIIVTSPTKAYVTLYQPEDNQSSDLTVDDVLVVNPQTGVILKTIDLAPLTANDGDRFARASSMVIVGDKIFVAVQDLPGNLALRPNQLGKLAVIDTTTDTVSSSIALAGRDPITMAYSPETGFIYVGDADFFNLNSPYGGIEVVDAETLKTEGIVIDDATLGGAPGVIDVNKTLGFVTAGFGDPVAKTYATKVVSFNLNTLALSDVYQSTTYIQDIAVAPDGDLLVGDRDPHINGVLFFDANGKWLAGPTNVGPAPSSITFVER